MTSSTAQKNAPRTSESFHLEGLLREKRVLVCVGSGGVGKTTTAAALALLASTLGRRALVITIDPARRLANSLGLDGLAHQPKTLSRDLLVEGGIEPLVDVDAMMLDLQAAWDDLLQRTSPSPQMQEKLLENRFYKHLTRDLPGAQEFIACEALQNLLDKDVYDLIILDTPPTRNALDFLEAPSRILDFLENEAMRNFYDKLSTKVPGKGVATRMGLRLFEGATGIVQSAISKFTGPELLDDLGDFLGLIRDFVEPLKVRSRAFQQMLNSDAASFIVVTAPEAGPLNEALYFASELEERAFPIGGVLVNRVMPSVGMQQDHGNDDVKVQWNIGEPEEIEALLEQGFPDADVQLAELSYSLHTAMMEQQSLAARDKKAIQKLRAELPNGTSVLAIARQEGDVADVSRLKLLFPDLLGKGILRRWLSE
ncbi:MAG: ArsA family ATPase [Deltaproteobacteria bacterium]|nr:ArsA family ATPase [Deltaproteobacteria bacterium]